MVFLWVIPWEKSPLPAGKPLRREGFELLQGNEGCVAALAHILERKEKTGRLGNG